jgi:hypothetical protein
MRSSDNRCATGENDQPTIPLKADESAVEQVVDAGREQQAVLAVEALLIVEMFRCRCRPGGVRVWISS